MAKRRTTKKKTTKKRRRAAPRSLLPGDWRKRRFITDKRKRFELEQTTTGWQVVDWAYSKTIDTGPDKLQALRIRDLAEDYTKKWGDVDFSSFPYSLDQTFEYDDRREVERSWREDFPPTAW